MILTSGKKGIYNLTVHVAALSLSIIWLMKPWLSQGLRDVIINLLPDTWLQQTWFGNQYILQITFWHLKKWLFDTILNNLTDYCT